MNYSIFKRFLILLLATSGVQASTPFLKEEENNPILEKVISLLTSLEERMDTRLVALDKRLTFLEQPMKQEPQTKKIKKEDVEGKNVGSLLISTIALENHDNSLKTFKPKDDNYTDALGTAKNFLAYSFDTKAFSLGMYIYGPAGTGKTHLLTSLLKEFQSQKRKVLFIRPDDIFSKINLPYLNDEKRKNFIFSHDVFILDDFNSQLYALESGFLQPILYDFHGTGGKIMIITSNRDFEDFKDKNKPRDIFSSQSEGSNTQRFMRRTNEIFEKRIFQFTVVEKTVAKT